MQLYGQLVIGANGYLGHLIGQTRTFEVDGHRDKQALRANGHLGKMGTRKHEHQSKEIFAANGHFGA